MAPQTAIEPILAKICATAMFVRSRRLQRFLTYVTQWSVDHPGEPLKEYGIAMGVYDKHSSFDPQADPIIRVESSRLRSRNIRKLSLTENTVPVTLTFLLATGLICAQSDSWLLITTADTRAIVQRHRGRNRQRIG